MSNFKLDFDISSLSRPKPRKTRKPPASPPASSPKERSATLDQTLPAKADEAPELDDELDSGEPSKPSRTALLAITLPSLPQLQSLKCIFAFIVLFASLAYWLGYVYVFAAPPPTFVTVSRCLPRNQAVVCESACRVRGGCSTAQMVEFATKECADAIHTVHLHSADGKARRVPAFYLRVPNTSAFEFYGDRAIFRPASCDADMRNAVPPAWPALGADKLAGYLWWISGKSARRFDVVRDSSIVAELNADVVLHQCYAATHCVFKLPMECRAAKATQVFADTTAGKKKAETFVSC